MKKKYEKFKSLKYKNISFFFFLKGHKNTTFNKYSKYVISE